LEGEPSAAEQRHQPAYHRAWGDLSTYLFDRLPSTDFRTSQPNPELLSDFGLYLLPFSELASTYFVESYLALKQQQEQQRERAS
jgi:hypothetical protein